MKKTFLAVTVALVFGFVSAVAMCLQALSAKSVAAFSDGMRIVVDAGHGGIDVGVSGDVTGARESDINLAISTYLKESLEELGFEVILTRKTEAGLYDTTAKGFKKRDMQKRKEIIERAQPTAILSIHQNHYPSQKVRGSQVFYAPQNAESKVLALGIQEKLNALNEEESIRPRKATAAEYFMLNCYPCPSVIVECGFLSSAEDERLLISPVWQKKVASTIASATLAYFAEFSA